MSDSVDGLTPKRHEYVSSHTQEEKWFLADLEGNALLPQTGLGIAFFVLDSLLSDGLDKEKLHRFSHYSPKRDEIEKAEKIMSSFHNRFGVDQKLNERFLYEGRVEDLFDTSKRLMLHVLADALERIMQTNLKKTDKNHLGAAVHFIDQLIDHPDFASAVSTLKQMSSIAVRSLRAEASGLCKEYKDDVRALNANVVTLKQKRREGAHAGPIIPVAEAVRRVGAPLVLIENQIVDGWMGDPQLSVFGKERLHTIMNGIQDAGE